MCFRHNVGEGSVRVGASPVHFPASCPHKGTMQLALKVPVSKLASCLPRVRPFTAVGGSRVIRTRFPASQIRAMGHDTDDPRKFGAQDPPMPKEQQSFPGTVRRAGLVLPINSKASAAGATGGGGCCCPKPPVPVPATKASPRLFWLQHDGSDN